MALNLAPDWLQLDESGASAPRPRQPPSRPAASRGSSALQPHFQRSRSGPPRRTPSAGPTPTGFARSDFPVLHPQAAQPQNAPTWTATRSQPGRGPAPARRNSGQGAWPGPGQRTGGKPVLVNEPLTRVTNRPVQRAPQRIAPQRAAPPRSVPPAQPNKRSPVAPVAPTTKTVRSKPGNKLQFLQNLDSGVTTSTTQGTSVATANSPAKTIPENTPAKDSKKPAANTQQQMDHAQEEGSDKASELRTVPLPIVGQRRGDEDNMGMSQSLEAEERFLRGLGWNGAYEDVPLTEAEIQSFKAPPTAHKPTAPVDLRKSLATWQPAGPTTLQTNGLDDSTDDDDDSSSDDEDSPSLPPF